MNTQLSMAEIKKMAGTLRPILAIADKRIRYPKMSELEAAWGKQVFQKVQDYCIQTEWFVETVAKEEEDGNPKGRKAEYGMTKWEAESAAGWDFTMDSVTSIRYQSKKNEPTAPVVDRKHRQYVGMAARIAMSNTAK